MPNIEQIKQDLRGPMMPIITSFKEDLSLDLDTVQENVRFLIDGGIITGKGVMLAVGAGGDFPMLSLEERKKTARAIVEAANGQTPVLVGAQDTDPRVSIEMAEYAREIGAYGIQASPPYYYEPSDADVIAFYRALNDAAQTPIMVYNTPWLVGYNMSFDVLDALANMEWVVALKWEDVETTAYTRGIVRFADHEVRSDAELRFVALLAQHDVPVLVRRPGQRSPRHRSMCLRGLCPGARHGP